MQGHERTRHHGRQCQFDDHDSVEGRGGQHDDGSERGLHQTKAENPEPTQRLILHRAPRSANMYGKSADAVTNGHRLAAASLEETTPQAKTRRGGNPLTSSRSSTTAERAGRVIASTFSFRRGFQWQIPQARSVAASRRGFAGSARASPRRTPGCPPSFRALSRSTFAR